jgi:hypothetical protein
MTAKIIGFLEGYKYWSKQRLVGGKMNVLKTIWAKFRQLKWWAQVLVALTLVSVFGGITGTGSSDTSSSSTVASEETATEEATPTPTPTIDPEAEKAAEAKTAKELKNALAPLRIKTDSVTNKKWYYARTTTQYLDSNSLHVYIGQDQGSEPYLRLRIQYAGDDWLFINKFTLNVDGEVFVIEPDYGDMERDNDSDVWEWYDINPSDENVSMLKAIMNSTKAVIRCEGDQYYRDRNITVTEKKALKAIFTGYDALVQNLKAA